MPEVVPKETVPEGPTPLTVAVQVQEGAAPGGPGRGWQETVVVVTAGLMVNVVRAYPDSRLPGEALW